MKNRISGALSGAALIALCAAQGAQAQETPVVATINVPVTITNLDAEWAKKTFVSLTVACDVYSEASPPATPDADRSLAQGVQLIPLVETAATPTVRATLNYSGAVVVQTHAPRKPSGAGGSSDPETAAQSAAATAIRDAKSYACYFQASKSAVGGAGTGKGSAGGDPAQKLADALSKGNPEEGVAKRNTEAEKSSVYIVTGTFAPRPKK
jgi:hypothetical protein